MFVCIVYLVAKIKRVPRNFVKCARVAARDGTLREGWRSPRAPKCVALALLYCVLYSTVAMLLALILFEDRDLA